MPEQIYIGNIGKGQVTSREAFVIDNDAFPNLFNFYVWRGKVKRKRGTIFLGQLQIQGLISATPLAWQFQSFNAVAGAGNFIASLGLGATSSITPGSLTFQIVGDANVYTDALRNGTLQGSAGETGTINYATGAFTTSGGANGAVTGLFNFFPGLPVLGLRNYDYVSVPGNANVSTVYPFLLAFDMTKAYQVNQTAAATNFYNVSFYKFTSNPVIWSGTDYQQFWTTNFQSALWETNNKPGFNFKALTNVAGVSVTRVTATQVTITITAHALIVNDVIWINEVTGTIATGTGATQNQNINGQTGYVAVVVDPNTITVNFDGTKGSSLANFQGGATGAGGIAQYLTSGAAAVGRDGIKWFDGDPTGKTGFPISALSGWVNFAPPLTALTTQIAGLPAAKYYLVGALAIVSFKDRLVFFSPWIQTSGGLPIQLQDTALWSQVGTPYYAALTPVNQTFQANAYYVDQTGLGGYQPAGVALPIATVSNNEDVLIVGFGGVGRKTRFVYTGNDLQPFLWYTINSELPSDSTFSSITLDKGALDIGAYGIALTDQQSSTRIDLDIPDSVFQIQALNNGVQRVNAVRDFQNEWIYFSYPIFTSAWRFPTRSFLFNYRDNTWAILYENYTSHGTYRPTVSKSWLTTGFRSWNAWREAWNSGAGSPLYPNIIAGNPQGYVLMQGEGTGEGISGTIRGLTNVNNLTQINSIDHCVQVGDYLYITGCLGTTDINGLIGRVITVVDASNFVIDLAFPAGVYLGAGKFTRLSQPLVQTKQFNPYWDQGRKTRLAVQKYLLDSTFNSQVTVNIYLSQDPDDVWNGPQDNPAPNGLVYSQLMYTCPESANIGLTPANANLQMPTAADQNQIWHRFNTSMIGDTVQVGITLNDDQMRNLTFATSEITIQGIHLVVDKSSQLA